MLRKIRRTLALVFLIFATLLFLDFTGTIHAWFGWIARIQFMPALLALNVGVVVFLLLLTLVFGRIYCSVICPLGVFQDVVSRISGMRKKKKSRFTYSPAVSWLRYSVLILFVAAMIAGIGSFVVLLSPYSSFGRIASNLFAPLYQWGNNVLAYFAERADSYAFYSVDVWLKSVPTFVIACVTLIVIVVLAWRNGRTYCNTICPVGTVLGLISRYAMFRPVIDADKCRECSLCSRKCKASCVDYKAHKIDYSRCVDCFDCIDACKHDALKYRFVWSDKNKSVRKPAQTGDNAKPSKSVDTSRRNFMIATASLAAAATVEAQEKKVDGGLAFIEKKKIPKRNTPITPPGSGSAERFASKCTGCQLCVSVCPNEVLRPSTDITRLMQPEMSYERGYCRPECTKCSEVCPTDAIHLIDRAEKSSTQIGHAVLIPDNCIVNRDHVQCGNCARHCPSGAIVMVPKDPDNPDSLRLPVVNVERCIGCGACENLCPARPFSAIYVEGHERHRNI